MNDFIQLYREMFAAKQAGDKRLADSLMLQIERTRTLKVEAPKPEVLDAIGLILPAFARSVLGKTQKEVDQGNRSNCINAALNFSAESPRMQPYTPDELLSILQNQYQQIFEESHRFGDLVCTWSRTYGVWDNRLINVHEMDPRDPDFPYGLIFDHAFIEVTPLLVFHKPDPTLESRYGIEFFDSVISVTVNNFGFETTRHRRLG